MRGFWLEVDKALAAVGKRRPWIAEKTGIALGRINNWYVRGTLPRADDAEKIARVLGITVRQLMTGTAVDTIDNLPEDIREYIRAYMLLPEEKRGRIMVVCRAIMALVEQGILDMPLDIYLKMSRGMRGTTPSASPEPSA